MNTLTTINLWHRRARPEPTPENFNVQLGCHLEEIVEMFRTMDFDVKTAYMLGVPESVIALLEDLSHALKHGEVTAAITDRKELLDSLADQVVTAVGTGHCAGMDVPTACERVDRSNWSKYDADGQPMFNEHGKIMKGYRYAPPDLEGLY